MADHPIELKSVNWSAGMFLTPEHFLQQERYLDSLWLWLLHYSSAVSGVIGSGPRVKASEYGAIGFDPVVVVEDADDTLHVSVSQCRAITPGGTLIEIGPERPVHRTFPKADLHEVYKLGIFVVARPGQKTVDDSSVDPVNPEIPAARFHRYELSLDVPAADKRWSLEVAKLRRADAGLRFEMVADFIPLSAFMLSHSELMAVFRRVNERVTALADRYGELHRAIVGFIARARSHGLNVEPDLETLNFVGRMVTAIEECAYAIVDPTQAPSRFFRHVNRLTRGSALFLSLSPPTREYFRLLGDVGVAEFVPQMEQDLQALVSDRHSGSTDDLRTCSQQALTDVERAERLEQALEGKYLDYRVSPSLESINFAFDLTGSEPVLYRSMAKPARPMIHGQDVTFVFAPLRIENRDELRVILIGDRSEAFGQGAQITAEIAINPSSGHSGATLRPTASCDIPQQKNIALDFRGPGDVPTVTDVRVTLRSTQPIRSAMLYTRGRLRAEQRATIAPPLRPQEPGQRVRPPVVADPVTPAPPISRKRIRDTP